MLAAKPQKVRAKGKTSGVAKLSPEDRAWSKAEATGISAFLWQQRLSDLKTLMNLYGLSPNSVVNRSQAVVALFELMAGDQVLPEDVESIANAVEVEVAIALAADEEVEEDTSEEEA